MSHPLPGLLETGFSILDNLHDQCCFFPLCPCLISTSCFILGLIQMKDSCAASKGAGYMRESDLFNCFN